MQHLYYSPSVSHTLPAGPVHPRPVLETSSSHKMLKRYSSAGPDTLLLPPPDYADLNHKEDHEQAVSTDAHEPSGQWLSKSLLIFKNQKRDKRRRRRETLGTRVGQVRECLPPPPGEQKPECVT